LKTARAHELCNLLWRDVDLANGRLFIGRSKTPAGLREIRMLPVLRDILAAYRRPPTAAIPTTSSSRPSPTLAATRTTCASASSPPCGSPHRGGQLAKPLHHLLAARSEACPSQLAAQRVDRRGVRGARVDIQTNPCHRAVHGRTLLA
jgi:integrase